MAAVSTSPCPAVGGCLWTRRQLKRGFWMGKSSRCAVAECAWGRFAWSGGLGPRLLLVRDGGQERRESRTRWRCAGRDDGTGGGEGLGEKPDEEDEEVDRALNLDGGIPKTADDFLKQVSSNAYDLRRQLEQNIEASSYDVLDANPWRGEAPKPVYVLAQEENRLLTMRTRRARSEVERELGLLFPGRGKSSLGRGRRSRRSAKVRRDGEESESPPPAPDTGLRMHVEDVREGVLVFEDEEEAAQYCSLLEGQGKNCTAVAELDASDVFNVCQRTQRLAVLFRRGTTPPQPDRLQLNLKARKRSLEDQT